MLGNLAARKGRSRTPSAVRFDREAAYDQLADAARMYLDLAVLYEILK
jgi:hypothetical protein